MFGKLETSGMQLENNIQGVPFKKVYVWFITQPREKTTTPLD